MEGKNLKYEIGEASIIESQEDINELFKMIPAKIEYESQSSKSPLDIKWPHLEVGQLLEIEGAPFRVARLNASTVVLRPESGKYSARYIMGKIRRSK